jgi:nicotinamidase-related amidase
MQNAFLREYRDSRTAKDACEVINYCSQLMRDAGQTVVHVRDIEDAEEMDEEELAIHSNIDIKPSDIHLDKEFSNAFFQTDLTALLQEQGVDLVILCGQAAEHCVVFTYNGAVEQGFTPVILQEGAISAKAGRADMLMQDRNVISHAAIRALVRS